MKQRADQTLSVVEFHGKGACRKLPPPLGLQEAVPAYFGFRAAVQSLTRKTRGSSCWAGGSARRNFLPSGIPAPALAPRAVNSNVGVPMERPAPRASTGTLITLRS